MTHDPDYPPWYSQSVVPGAPVEGHGAGPARAPPPAHTSRYHHAQCTLYLVLVY